MLGLKESSRGIMPKILLARVWDSWIATKVFVFSLQILQDRIPTRQNLRRRRVIVGANNTSCVFCGAVEESVDHLFVSFERIFSIWYRVSRWLGKEYVSPNSITQVFEGFFGLGGASGSVRYDSCVACCSVDYLDLPK
jgi:hypothetical protein